MRVVSGGKGGSDCKVNWERGGGGWVRSATFNYLWRVTMPTVPSRSGGIIR
jgi:hypothetical protein